MKKRRRLNVYKHAYRVRKLRGRFRRKQFGHVRHGVGISHGTGVQIRRPINPLNLENVLVRTVAHTRTASRRVQFSYRFQNRISDIDFRFFSPFQESLETFRSSNIILDNYISEKITTAINDIICNWYKICRSIKNKKIQSRLSMKFRLRAPRPNVARIFKHYLFICYFFNRRNRIIAVRFENKLRLNVLKHNIESSLTTAAHTLKQLF